MKKHCITDRICVKNVNRMRLIEAITLHGAILEENINEQSCVAVVNTGKMNAVRALVAIVLKKDAVQFAAYAKEGLIKQGLAQGAIEKIKKELT